MTTDRTRNVAIATRTMISPGGGSLASGSLSRRAGYRAGSVDARDGMPDGGKVHVRAERARDRVRVTVADEGTGIAPEHLAHLFQPFFTTKGSAGTGLGLWLAQGTMRRIGGAITARNRRAGGAEFLVELQVAGNGHPITPGRARLRRRERTARRG